MVEKKHHNHLPRWACGNPNGRHPSYTLSDAGRFRDNSRRRGNDIIDGHSSRAHSHAQPEREQGTAASLLPQLYDDTANLLYSLAVRILSDTADAEEVVLDV